MGGGMETEMTNLEKLCEFIVITTIRECGNGNGDRVYACMP